VRTPLSALIVAEAIVAQPAGIRRRRRSRAPKALDRARRIAETAPRPDRAVIGTRKATAT
jgi:hypothetical protein